MVSFLPHSEALEQSADAKLKAAVRAAIEEHPGPSNTAIAESVVAQNPDLVSAWVLERITWLVRTARRTQNPYQMFLPGFKTIEQRLPVEDGFVRLRLATITTLRHSLKALRATRSDKPSPNEVRLRKLIAEMEPYAKTQRGLTVERYCELRASGVESEAKPEAAKKAAKGKS
jgi:hypothetical protein